MTTADAIFRVVLDVSWRSSCLVLVVLALRGLLRRHLPARVLFWVWIAVAVRLLLPVAIPSAWSPFNFAPFAHRSDPGIALGMQAGASGPSPAEATPPAGSEIGALREELLSQHAGLTLGQWIALGWGAGVVALIFARVVAYGRFTRKLRRSGAEPSPAMARLLAEATSPLGARRASIRVTDAVRSPALHGFVRPTLLFPPGFLEKLTPREIQFTVAHELAHHERRDLLAQVLIHGAVILHWFNPLIWAVARIARQDCELACDEYVLRRLDPVERESYGATLLKIVTLASCGIPPPLALGVVESKRQIKRRIQMIAAHKSSPLARTLLACALFSLVTGLSLTAETRPQLSPEITESRTEPARKVMTGSDPSQWRFTYDASTDRLDALFPNGTVATVGERTIMVADVRRELKPLVPLLQRDAHDQADFDQRLNRLQNDVIRDLVSRILLIKEFHVPATDGNERHIPASYVDNAIADRLRDQFENDRTKLLASLQARGVTLSDYRHEVEEEIIYHYMVGQERKLNNPDPKKSKLESLDGKVHLRLIQLTRSVDTTDAALLEKANVILARLKNGELFEALAKEFSGDGRRSKGGDWGWMGPSDLKSEFSEKLFALKKSEVSAPIVTKEGCFLLYAEDRR